jgi:hypothetical protein
MVYDLPGTLLYKGMAHDMTTRKHARFYYHRSTFADFEIFTMKRWCVANYL